MEPELEPKPKSEVAMEASVGKEIGVIHIDPEEKLMPCVSNYKDNFFDKRASGAEQNGTSNRGANEELNITDCASLDDVPRVEGECGELTESSSSFGNTISGMEDCSMLDGDEVESRYCDNLPESLYDAFPRKKKLTSHWRKFIRPLMWRCKWLELQIKELQSQTLKYDAELAEYDKLKQYEFGSHITGGFDVKSIPISSPIQRNKFMKRKKRKRVEDTTNIVSYTSNHKLFSYFEHKSSVDGSPMKEDYGNSGDQFYRHHLCRIHEFGCSAGKSILGIDQLVEFSDDNNVFEDVIRKIEVVYSQLCGLKTRRDRVVMENPALLESPQSLAPDNEDKLLAESLPTESQHNSEYNTGSFFLPGGVVSSHGGLNSLPVMIENTVQPWVDAVGEIDEGGYLISSAAVKKEQQDVEDDKEKLMQKPLLPSTEQKINLSVSASKTVPKKSRTQQPDSTTRTDFPWNTRNRGKRKVGSYRLSRKS